MPHVVADIAKVTRKRLALVVATHEHADHVSGFARFAADFAGFEIGEVWMPWAMDLDDPDAASLRARRLALAEALLAHFRAGGVSGAALDAVLNAVDNATALRALRSGFSGAARAVRYLAAGETPALPVQLSGLEVRVLGPPRDPALLKKMLPPASQRFLRADAGGQVAVDAVQPFADLWRLRDAATARLAYGLTAEDERRLRDDAQSFEEAAFALDSHVNNTSLVLLFSAGGRGLLFPGDAQWGNWKGWLDQPTAAQLLEEVAFLKVAHHGSHNATPRQALEGMRQGAFVAMLSTQSKPWPSIPQQELMAALHARASAPAVRSDALDARRPRLPPGFKTDGRLWIDYRMTV
jgi:hypothetical protein